MVSCSLIVLTHNEEDNLTSCLDSVQGLVEEIFVVDSGSTDRTPEIAERYTSHVVTHEFTNQAEQFNWALDNLPLRTDWILRLDADEFLLPELKEELAQALPALPECVTGLYMKRRMYFKGRWIRHGGYYPIWILRVFRRGQARSEAREKDEHIVPLRGETRRLRHDLVDYNRKDLAFWTAKHEQYATREVRGFLNGYGPDHGSLEGQAARKRWLREHVYVRTPLFLRAFVYFGYRYILLGGFLDGVEGLVFHFLQGCWYRFYVDAKLWEARRSEPKYE